MENSNDAARIRHSMARIRQDLDEHVDDVVDKTKQLTDWRHYVRSYPWACVGAAVAVGFFVVPKRTEIVSPDADQLEKLSKRNRLVVTRKPKATATNSLAASTLSLVGGVLLRTVMTYVGQQFGEFAQKNQNAAPNSPVN